MGQNEKTRALLAAFGCALAYLLAGKALTAVLPQVPEEAARMWAFVHRRGFAGGAVRCAA